MSFRAVRRNPKADGLLLRSGHPRLELPQAPVISGSRLPPGWGWLSPGGGPAPLCGLWVREASAARREGGVHFPTEPVAWEPSPLSFSWGPLPSLGLPCETPGHRANLPFLPVTSLTPPLVPLSPFPHLVLEPLACDCRSLPPLSFSLYSLQPF